MGIRWLDVGALVVSLLCLCACTNDDDGDDAPGAARGASTTTAAATTSGASSSTRGDASGALVARAGTPLQFEVQVARASLGERAELLGAYAVGTKVAVSLRRAEDAPGRETSAYFGHAEVRAVDGRVVRFAVSGRMPPMVWQREQRARFALELPTPAGEYEVALPGVFAQRVTVTEPAVVDPTSTVLVDRGTPADRVLGERDLAGVAFGAPEAEAVARLAARFGRPDFDDVEATDCGEQRTVGWGSLVTTYRADPRAGGGKVFSGFTYHAPRAASVGGPAELRTTNGLPAGASLAELRSVETSAVFATEQVGYAVTTWFAAPGSRLAGRLSDDVSAPDVAVTEVSSSIGSQDRPTYPGCVLVTAGR